jgi:integral membrane protein (TIGR01906 family)
MWLFFRAQPIAGTVLLLAVASGVLAFRKESVGPIQTMIIAGVGATLLFALIVGGLSLVDFESLFIQFHMLSFSNDLWQLDPQTDYLLILYPEPFWLDTTLRIAWTTLIQIAALAGVAWVLPHWRMP